MSNSNKQVEFLARAIVNRLEDRGLVEFGDAEEGIHLVARTLDDNFATADAIEQEAKQRLVRALGREPKAAEIEEEMQRVAAERDFVL
jgi:hypothetical protein